METGGNPTENFASVRSLFLAEVLNSPTNGYAQFLSASTPGQSRGTASFSKDLDFEVAEMAEVPVLSVAILGGDGNHCSKRCPGGTEVRVLLFLSLSVQRHVESYVLG